LVQDYGFRIYNPSIARFLSVDPLAPDYPELTTYQFASNTPIQAIDLDGLESVRINDDWYATEISKRANIDNMSDLQIKAMLFTKMLSQETTHDGKPQIEIIDQHAPFRVVARYAGTESWSNFSHDNYITGYRESIGHDGFLLSDMEAVEPIKMGYDASSQWEGGDDGHSSLPWTNPDGTMGAGQQLFLATVAIEASALSLGLAVEAYLAGEVTKMGVFELTLYSSGIGFDINTIATNLEALAGNPIMNKLTPEQQEIFQKAQTSISALSGLRNLTSGMVNTLKPEQLDAIADFANLVNDITSFTKGASQENKPKDGYKKE